MIRFPTVREIMLLLILAALPIAQAAETNTPPATSQTEASPSRLEFSPAAQPGSALVYVFNRPITWLRTAFDGSSPAERKQWIESRANELMGQKIFGPIESVRKTEGIVIMVGGHPLMAIRPDDVDPIQGMTIDQKAADAVARLKEALESAHTQQSWPFFLRAVGKSAAATAVLSGIIFLLVRFFRRVSAWEKKWERACVERLVKRNLHVLSQIFGMVRWLPRLIFWVIVISLVAECLSLCLQWFPYTRPWANSFLYNVRDIGAGIFKATLSAIPDLITIAVIVVITRFLVGLARGFFSRIESGRVTMDWMDVEAARATRRILTFVLWVLAIVMIYPYIPGSSSAAFKGMSVFVGLLLSLGSTSVIGQLTSGLVLMYSRALKPGEYVSIGEHEGTILYLGFLSTQIRSPKNEEFYVPNTVILGTTIKNYTRLASRGGLLLHTTVTIGYDAPWRQVHAMLIEAAKRTEGLGSTPPPFVLQIALSDFYVEYQVNACLSNPEDRIQVLADLHAHIQDVFNEYGVQIMSPHYRADKDHPVIVPRANWRRPPAAPDKTD